MRRILVVGAGWGGQGACAALAGEDLPDDVEVVCVDSRDSLGVGATWQFELDGRAAAVALPLADTVAAPYLRRGEVVGVDFAAKTAALADGSSLAYDVLVLACGAVSDPTPIPGLATCVDLTAPGFAEPMETFLDGLRAGGPRRTAVVSICKAPYKCPPLPFEAAFLLDAAARRRGVRDRLDVVVTCPVPWPFGGPDAKRAFAAAMAEKGIAYRPNVAVARVEDAGDGARTVFLAAGDAEPEALRADLFLATFPHVAAPLVDRGMLNAKGSLPVDLRSNRVAGADGAYCVGDACAAVVPAVKAPIPKAGEFAWEAGVAVGALAAASLRGEPEALPTARRARCVAEAGEGRGIVVGPDFSAAFADPEAGTPVFEIAAVDSADGKVAWINDFLRKFARPGRAPVFAPADPS